MTGLKEYIRIVGIAAIILLAAFFLGIIVNVLNPLGVELNPGVRPETPLPIRLVKVRSLPKASLLSKEGLAAVAARAAKTGNNENPEMSAGEMAAVAAVEKMIKNRGPEPSALLPWIKIDLPRAKALFDSGKVKFIDARPEFKYLEKRIRGSISLSASRYLIQFPVVKEKISRDDIIVVYCNNPECKLSDNVANNLTADGYKNIFVFEAGWQAWVDAGYPVDGLEAK